MQRQAERRRWGVPVVAMTLAAAGLGLAACSGSSGGAALQTPSSAAVRSMPPRSPSPSPSTPPSSRASSSRPLLGKVIVIDPGHNGGNAAHASQIDRLVDVVTERKPCDTTGTETNDGYPEYAFTLDVAKRAARILRAQGATVVLTRTTSTGVGPCITQRAAIGNRAHADAAISIHADGAPASGHGFHVIRPGDVGPNAAIVAPSRVLARDVRDAFRSGTGEPYSNYLGTDALVTRTDLGGLNLSTVPKVFIECGNMRNAADAARLKSAAFRARAAAAIAAGLASYVRST